MRSVKYLGHIVSEDGVATDMDKTSPIPTTEKELRSFIGLASYYRRYIEEFASIARPLHALCSSTKPG